jgi:hypothetical protein
MTSHEYWVLTEYVSAGLSGRSMFHDGSVVRRSDSARAENAQRIQNVIDTLFIGTIGFTRDELALVFTKTKKGYTSSVSDLRPFLLAMISAARKDVGNEINLLHAAQALLPLSESQRARYQTRLSQFGEVRTGPWDDSVDLPALNRALYLMAIICNVSPYDVAEYIIKGNQAIGPAHPHHGHWDDLQFATRQPRKRTFIMCIFDLFARRSNPWEWITNQKMLAHGEKIESLVSAHISSAEVQYPDPSARDRHSPAIDPRPKIRWDDQAHLSLGRDMLNAVASSNPTPLQPFALGFDDWNGWYKLLNGEDRLKLPTKTTDAIDAVLVYAWNQNLSAFARPRPKYFIHRIKRLVSLLNRGLARARGGQWEEETFFAIAM